MEYRPPGFDRSSGYIKVNDWEVEGTASAERARVHMADSPYISYLGVTNVCLVVRIKTLHPSVVTI